MTSPALQEVVALLGYPAAGNPAQYLFERMITAAGLVGRIVDVTLNAASVRLITDPGFRIGVKHVLTGDIGVASGRGEGQALRVDVGLDADSEISRGERVTRSARCFSSASA